MLNFRHGDGSNQLGDLHPGAYSDYTGYVPVNSPSTVPVNPKTVSDPNHWQPLQYHDASGNFVIQKFVGAQWFKVVPFAMTSPDEFLSFTQLFGPALYGSQQYRQQAQELIDFSADLTDRQKMIAEYWANGPHTELPPGHWDLFAQYVSARDNHSLDDDVKMFFALTNAIFDAGIASWNAKRNMDSVRPATAIPYLFEGTQIQSWGGPGKGTVWMDGSQWIPYQPSTFPTPPFPEYISGHSTFSAAGATILFLWTGSDQFGDSVTFAPGSSAVRTGDHAQESGDVSVGDVHRRRQRGGYLPPLWGHPLQGRRPRWTGCGRPCRVAGLDQGAGLLQRLLGGRADTLKQNGGCPRDVPKTFPRADTERKRQG